jgi:hypothetical protein
MFFIVRRSNFLSACRTTSAGVTCACWRQLSTSATGRTSRTTRAGRHIARKRTFRRGNSSAIEVWVRTICSISRGFGVTSHRRRHLPLIIRSNSLRLSARRPRGDPSGLRAGEGWSLVRDVSFWLCAIFSSDLGCGFCYFTCCWYRVSNEKQDF